MHLPAALWPAFELTCRSLITPSCQVGCHGLRAGRYGPPSIKEASSLQLPALHKQALTHFRDAALAVFSADVCGKLLASSLKLA